MATNVELIINRRNKDLEFEHEYNFHCDTIIDKDKNGNSYYSTINNNGKIFMLKLRSDNTTAMVIVEEYAKHKNVDLDSYTFNVEGLDINDTVKPWTLIKIDMTKGNIKASSPVAHPSINHNSSSSSSSSIPSIPTMEKDASVVPYILEPEKENPLTPSTSEFDVSMINKKIDGKKNGLWMLYDDKDRLEECGVYIDGKQSGAWNVFNEDGTLNSCGMYENGKREGPWIIYYSSGKINSKGMMKNDEQYGEWKAWNEDGSFKKNIIY